MMRVVALAAMLVLARPEPATPPEWAGHRKGWMSDLLRGMGDET
jgi:hypothetical protein